MDVRELRIGNWVECNASGHQFQIGNINNVYVTEILYEDDTWFSIQDIDPIPLTEEKLVNMFGFERVESPDPDVHPWADYVKDNVVISMPYFEFSYSYGDDPVEIKYVHSIQNLFFAVKQRELEVK